MGSPHLSLIVELPSSSLTLVFMSAFWMVYPVISVLPSSLGGSHSSAALKPQTSVTFTFRGGPGLSEGTFSTFNEFHTVHAVTDILNNNIPAQVETDVPSVAETWLTTLPTILMTMLALSSMFSIFSTSSYVPECSLSAERMKRMLSTFELRTLTIFSSRGWPSLNQVATGRGLPCKTQSWSTVQDKKDSRVLASHIIKNLSRALCLTWKGTVRLILSPTFLMYFVLRSRGRRILGCSKVGKDSWL